MGRELMNSQQYEQNHSKKLPNSGAFCNRRGGVPPPERQITDNRPQKKILRCFAPQYDKSGGRRQTTDHRFLTEDDNILQSVAE